MFIGSKLQRSILHYNSNCRSIFKLQVGSDNTTVVNSKDEKCNRGDKPWITPAIKLLIKDRQQAFHSQNLPLWRTLRHMKFFCRKLLAVQPFKRAGTRQRALSYPERNTPLQLIQCSTVPNNKKLQICKSARYPSLITRNSSRARQPLSRVNLFGFTTPTSS